MKTVVLFSVAPLIDFSCPPLFYQYYDTLYKMWQTNNRDCNKKSTVNVTVSVFAEEKQRL